MIHDPVQILGPYAVKLHILVFDHRKDASFVHKPDTLHEGPAQDLALEIGFSVKAVVNDLRKIDSQPHKLSRDLHGLCRGAAETEHPGIVDDSGVKTFRQFLVKQILGKLSVEHLRRGTGSRLNHIFPGIAGVSHMMVHADACPRRLQIRPKFSQTLLVAAVQTDAQVKCLLLNIGLDLIIAV